DSVANANSYRIERCIVRTSNGCPTQYEEIANVAGNTYTDTSANTSQYVYHYRVRASNSSGSGPYTSWIASRKRLYLTSRIVCENGATPTYPTQPNGPISLMGWYSIHGAWPPPSAGFLSYSGVFLNTP